MTEQHGLFTVQTWLALTDEQRARLEWLVREEGGDLADTVTRIVAGRGLATLPVTEEPPAGEPLPVRVYLSAAQRAALERLVHERKLPLPAILTQIVAERLAAVPAPPAREERAAAAPSAAEQRRRRNELARLRARRDAAGATAPPWLHAYIAELEDELAAGGAGERRSPTG